jgi:hypothetical protein
MRGVNSQGNVGLFPQTCVEIIRDTISSSKAKDVGIENIDMLNIFLAEFTKPGIWDRPAGPIHSLSTPNPAYGGFSAHEYSVSLRPSYSEVLN